MTGWRLAQMVNHGLSTGALFLLVGMALRATPHPRDRRARRLSQKADAGLRLHSSLVVMLSSIGLPGLNGFVGEFLILLGAFVAHRWWAVVATAGVILAALYLLWAYQRVFHGPNDGDNADMPDLTGTCEIAWCSCRSSSAIVFMGIYPKPVHRPHGTRRRRPRCPHRVPVGRRLPTSPPPTVERDGTFAELLEETHHSEGGHGDEHVDDHGRRGTGRPSDEHLDACAGTDRLPTSPTSPIGADCIPLLIMAGAASAVDH